MADSMSPLQRAVAADSAARGTDKLLRRASQPADRERSMSATSLEKRIAAALVDEIKLLH
jgi:hypothetical protein